ncbi:MAG TPA: transposase [Acetobacteraceae bacterium]|nr:transposase [Acetobacteraceae bacterium]
MRRRSAASSRRCSGYAGPARRGATCRRHWGAGRASTTAGGAGACAAGGNWCSRPCARACRRTGCCSHHLQGAPRGERGAGSTAAAEALGRSRGGLCSKLHACADGAGRILRLVASPGNHSDLRYAAALASGIPACDAALDRGYVSAALRAAFAAEGGAVHTPPKRGMVDPPRWDPALYARRHKIENLFSRLKDWARIALHRDKTRRSWMGFAHLAATIINLRLAESGHRP